MGRKKCCKPILERKRDGRDWGKELDAIAEAMRRADRLEQTRDGYEK